MQRALDQVERRLRGAESACAREQAPGQINDVGGTRPRIGLIGEGASDHRPVAVEGQAQTKEVLGPSVRRDVADSIS